MVKQLKDIGYEVKETYKPNPKETIPYISLEHVEPQSLHLCGISTSEAIESNKFRFKMGDVLFSTLRPYFRKLIIAPVDGVCSTEFSVVRPFDQEDLHYLFYCMAQKSFIELTVANSSGDRPRTKWELFSKFEIHHITVHDRKKIGAVLAKYDDLIANNRRRIKLLEESARLLYREWFVHFRFPGHEDTRIINSLPEGWKKKPLRDCFTLNYGKALKSEVRTDGPFPVYGSSGIIGSHNKALVEGAGIIVGRKGNVGSVFWATADFWPIDTVYFVHRDESNLYLYYALQNMTFTSTDVAVPGLNRNFAYSREILIPKEKILSEFITEASLIRKQIETLEKYNHKLAEARDLLLPRLMSGELEV